MTTAFYLPRGDHRYEPTHATESPWDGAMQHGGPPAALLAHVMAPGGDLRLARMAVDFLAPIPRLPCTVEVSPLKPGRLTFLTEARLVIDGRVAVTARGWHIAAGPPPPAETPAVLPPPMPATADAGRPGWGYGEAIEWRFVEGGFAGSAGSASAWTRVRLPLVDGEEMTGTARALIVADSANGLSAALPMDEWLSIPPAMTTTLLRPPGGDWVHLACRTDLSPDGVGLTHGDLSDPGGRVGVVSQPLVVRHRN
jgi:acyl-Coa thioesterase superfamily protein/acyl-CoA thioesterase superfamily protein